MLFDSLESLGRVALVGLLAYAGLVVVLRLAGKRALAKLNAFDLVVTVAFGSILATIILSASVSLADGLLALVGLALLQFIVSRASVASRGFARLARSTPCLLVRDGRYLEEAMTRERVTAGEIDASIRNEGIGRIEDVAAVVLESDGSLSVIAADGKDGELTALRSVES
jgi:uncharacterized membrane protein YcaP (DUF421 family)